ncbi:helix-turn-helix domain-containing protein [Natrialbaceae archaeon A-CW1-1]
MVGEKELRILSTLDSPKQRQELADELGYQKSTISRALGTLEQLDLIYKDRKGNQTIANPTNARCIEVLQSLTKSNPHIDFPDLFTSSMLNVLYYLNSREPWTATELAERTEHSRATIYRSLKTLTNRAMAIKEQSRYKLTGDFNELHTFAYELRHHIHQVRIKRDVEGGTIVRESHKEFLVQTEKAVENSDYHRTGLDAFAEYGLQFFTTSERYYFYSEKRDSLTPEDVVCHLLLIENDSRHRKYALLLVAETGVSLEKLAESAKDYGIMEVVAPLIDFLRTQGEISSDRTPQWEEFETLASDYGVDL